jgi:hypothetical protein
VGVNGVLVELVQCHPVTVEVTGSNPVHTAKPNFMRYKLQLTNGSSVFFDEYSLSRKGIYYKNGTVEVYMLNEMFNIKTLERVRKNRK